MIYKKMKIPLDKNYLSKLQEETIILGELETEGNKFF